MAGPSGGLGTEARLLQANEYEQVRWEVWIPHLASLWGHIKVS